MKHLLVTLLAALTAALLGIAVDRSLFRPEADAIDAHLVALETQLARSRAVRDSLEAVIARKQHRLRRLAASADSLSRVLTRLEAAHQAQHQRLVLLREQTVTPHEHTPDALHRDLSRILHLLPARAGTAERAP